MRCPHCEAALPDKARFCLSCGKPVERERPAGADLPPGATLRSAAAGYPPGGSAGRSRDMRGVILAVVAAFALVLGSFAWVLTQQSRRTAGNLTQLSPPAANPGPVTANPAPETQKQPQPPTENILPYLQRLGQIEAMRRQLDAALADLMIKEVLPSASFPPQLRDLLGPDTDQPQSQGPDPAALMMRNCELLAKYYQALSMQFQRSTPPVPMDCRELHGLYATGLSMMPLFVRSLETDLAQKSVGGVSQLGALGNAAFAGRFKAADREMDRLCRSHGIDKPFDINTDIGPGSASRFLGQ